MLNPTPMDWIIETFSTVLEVPSEYLMPAQKPSTIFPARCIYEKWRCFKLSQVQQRFPILGISSAGTFLWILLVSLSTVRLFLNLISISLVFACNEPNGCGVFIWTSSVVNSLASVTVHEVFPARSPALFTPFITNSWFPLFF